MYTCLLVWVGAHEGQTLMSGCLSKLLLHLFFFFFEKKFYFMYMGVFSLCVCLCTVGMECLQRSEEGTGSSVTRITDGR